MRNIFFYIILLISTNANAQYPSVKQLFSAFTDKESQSAIESLLREEGYTFRFVDNDGSDYYVWAKDCKNVEKVRIGLTDEELRPQGISEYPSIVTLHSDGKKVTYFTLEVYDGNILKTWQNQINALGFSLMEFGEGNSGQSWEYESVNNVDITIWNDYGDTYSLILIDNSITDYMLDDDDIPDGSQWDKWLTQDTLANPNNSNSPELPSDIYAEVELRDGRTITLKNNFSIIEWEGDAFWEKGEDNTLVIFTGEGTSFISIIGDYAYEGQYHDGQCWVEEWVGGEEGGLEDVGYIPTPSKGEKLRSIKFYNSTKDLDGNRNIPICAIEAGLFLHFDGEELILNENLEDDLLNIGFTRQNRLKVDEGEDEWPDTYFIYYETPFIKESENKVRVILREYEQYEILANGVKELNGTEDIWLLRFSDENSKNEFIRSIRGLGFTSNAYSTYYLCHDDDTLEYYNWVVDGLEVMLDHEH